LSHVFPSLCLPFSIWFCAVTNAFFFFSFPWRFRQGATVARCHRCTQWPLSNPFLRPSLSSKTTGSVLSPFGPGFQSPPVSGTPFCFCFGACRSPLTLWRYVLLVCLQTTKFVPPVQCNTGLQSLPFPPSPRLVKHFCLYLRFALRRQPLPPPAFRPPLPSVAQTRDLFFFSPPFVSGG